MSRTPVTLALLLAAAPLLLAAALAVQPLAYADDEPPQPAPAPAGEPGDGADADADADTKAERKTSEEAEKAFERLGKALHLPLHTVKKSMSAKASADLVPFGMPGAIEVTPTWTPEKGLQIAYEPSEELRAAMPPEQIEMATKVFAGWARDILAPVYESPNAYAKAYNCTHRRENERDIVEMTPFSEDAMVEQQTFYFDAEGLIERRVFIPKVDPTDPLAGGFAGQEIETTYGFEKRGDRNLVTQVSMLTAMGDIQGEYEYFEIEGRPPLLKKITMTNPFTAEPIIVAFEAYEIDGEKVGGTELKPVTGGEEEAEGDEDGEGHHDDADGEGHDSDGDDGDDEDDA